MMFRAGRAGGIRWLAAWSAAYALVLQLVLTSALIASLPRDGSAITLCLGLSSAAVDPADGDGGSKGAPLNFHCPACLARVDLARPPTPLLAPVLVRIALPLVFRLGRVDAQPASEFRLPVQPRAPPLPA